MPLIALVSAKSDGVTTSAAAMALGSRRPVLLAELDLAGGSLRHGLLRDVPRGAARERLDRHIGLHHLAQADLARAGEDIDFGPAVAQHFWPMDDTDNRVALPGLLDPRQAASLTSTWPSLLQVLRRSDASPEQRWDVIVDAGRVVLEGGRLHPVLSPALVLREADVVLLVTRSTAASLALADPVAQALHSDLMHHGSGTRSLGLLLLGSDFRVDDVQRSLETPVFGQLPWDEASAEWIERGGRMPRALGRGSRLIRAAGQVLDPLRQHADQRRLHLQMRSAAPSAPAAPPAPATPPPPAPAQAAPPPPPAPALSPPPAPAARMVQQFAQREKHHG
ncbi:hypothetical protein ACOKM5_43805 [Streptomyces sp. BH097]|uniref:hypothetical protein n=1 Tax=unclassified Streptomyces TaxID=2593676 RepID=UPI003BB507E0